MGKKGGGTATTTTEIPKQYKDFADQNLTIAGTIANQGYVAPPGARIAGFNPDDKASFDAIRMLPQQYQGQMDAASNTLQGLAGGSGITARDVAARDVAAQQITGRDVTAGQTAASSGAQHMGAYRNPYENQVVQQTIADMGRANQIAQNQLGGTAAGAGAYGGSRHGIANAETNRAFADRVAAATGGLRAQGFNTAADLGQTDATRYLASDTGNVDRTLTADRSNQSNSLQADRYNQQASLQADLANQAATAAMDKFNVGTQMGADKFNVGTQMGAAEGLQGLANQTANLGLGQAAALGQVGSQQRAMDQGSLDLRYQDFIDQINHPIRQLSIRQAALGQTPMGSVTRAPIQGGGAGSLMSGAGGLMKGIAALAACWVAREVYGETAPQWRMFRWWMLDKAPGWFRNLYLKYGERFAKYISDKPRLKKWIRKAMTAVLRREHPAGSAGHYLVDA